MYDSPSEHEHRCLRQHKDQAGDGKAQIVGPGDAVQPEHDTRAGAALLPAIDLFKHALKVLVNRFLKILSILSKMPQSISTRRCMTLRVITSAGMWKNISIALGTANPR